jgi:hypothetical protein
MSLPPRTLSVCTQQTWIVENTDVTSLKLHVDPQFVHRTLATQILGRPATGDIGGLSDELVEHLVASGVEDIRVAAAQGRLSHLTGRIALIRAGFYFNRQGTGTSRRVEFHDSITVDDDLVVEVRGELDPARFEANSPHANLRGRAHVFVAGVVLEAGDDPPTVRLRPVLIGFPYFLPPGDKRDAMFALRTAELSYVDVDQFGLAADDLSSPVPKPLLERLFEMSENEVKHAFAGILGQPFVPKDRPDETSDLVAQVSVGGTVMTAAFALKGPGGKRRPWTLYPGGMGKHGDQAIKLFHEPASLVIVQHVSHISESVRHLLEALALRHQKRFCLIDGAGTVRILAKAGLISPGA